jgi:phosphate transport system substrate-binding protein
MDHESARRKARRWRVVGTTALSVAIGLAGVLSTSLGASAATAHTSGPTIALSGAGSTFDNPFFTRAFYVYNQIHPNITVDYASIGSGGGEKQFEARTVNFGASDVPMLAPDLANVPASAGPVIQVPVDLGGVAIAYNLSGVSGQLKMTPAVLAQIFLGQIKNWNDPSIAAINPGAKFPNESITVVHRADSSGTSYIFTNYLSDISQTWATKVGIAKSVAWPTGIGGQGNEGVAGAIKDTPGAIGYVELAYVLTAHMTAFALENAKGDFVLPTKKSVADEAALHPHVTAGPGISNFSITDLGGPSQLAELAYPISGYSWALVYQNQTSTTTGTALVDLLYWLTRDSGGQKAAGALNYVPLPAPLENLALTELEKVVGSTGKKLLPTSTSALKKLLAS